MKDGATKSFVQGYNAQLAVDQEAQVIIACEVTQAPNDKQQAEPMVNKVASSPHQVAGFSRLRDKF